MSRLSWVIGSLFVCLALLVGCSQTPSVADNPSGVDFVRDANPISLAATQAFSLGFGPNYKLQAMSGLDIVTVQAKDLKGYPFVNVTLTAPEEIGDPWQFAEKLSGDEWKGQDDGSPWTVTVTGATEARDMFYSSSVGLDFLIKTS